ncbi:hypothetical protein Q3G72_011613 [Acer saccharum]|nr:hypothetical protein Q3G72_011613 [Acer saccharum]
MALSSSSKLVIIAFSISLFAYSSLAKDFSIVGYSPDDLASNDRLFDLFEQWLSKFEKAYESLEEKLKRFEIFKDNLLHIDETNKKVENYWLGLNEFADLSHEEFKKMYLGLTIDQNDLSRRRESHDDDQEDEFTYENEESETVTISGYRDVPQNNEQSLLKALVNQPLSVAIDASGRDFQFYSGGVFDGHCGTSLDHGVAAVGYGSTKGSNYIIVKNSWGPKWGEKGYIRMKMKTGKPEGLCGINKMASYPTKKK